MDWVKRTLDKFCSMSGQEISYEKSCILFSNNVTRGLCFKLCANSKFKETSCIGKYLGVPLKGEILILIMLLNKLRRGSLVGNPNTFPLLGGLYFLRVLWRQF